MSLIGFFPFKHAADALNNINAVSEGVVTEDLKLFLETNMPKVKYILIQFILSGFIIVFRGSLTNNILFEVS